MLVLTNLSTFPGCVLQAHQFGLFGTRDDSYRSAYPEGEPDIATYADAVLRKPFEESGAELRKLFEA